MSLDVYLNEAGSEQAVALLLEHGLKDDAERLMHGEEVYQSNITHNLGAMARAAGIYHELWRPEEIGITRAKQLIQPLKTGLAKLKKDPDEFKVHNASNGWGLYENFVPWVERYLDACIENPEASVSVSR
jgi:hypothetical protein